MGFPSGVQAFTTKQDSVDYPQASHINLLQTEVQAIETGLITGPLTLPASTLASLSVAGGSTVTTLNVTGGSTFASRPVMGPPDAVRLQLDAAVEIPTNSTTAIGWTNEVFITNSSMHSTGSNPSRVSPQSTGLYWCHAVVRYRTQGSTAGILWIEDSSGGNIAVTRLPNSGGDIFTIQTEGIKRFDATGGWVRAVVQVQTSTNSVAATGNESYFEVVKL